MRNLKALVVTGAFCAIACLLSSGARAESFSPEDSDHPFRIAAYGLHAFGQGVQYFITRPIHWFTSRPKMRYVFGNDSNPRTDDYVGDPDLYQRKSY